MLFEIKKALTDTPDDGLIYLAKKLSDTTGFFVSNKHILYIVKNNDGEAEQCICTEYLNLTTNIEIMAFAPDQQFESGKYNILDFIPSENGYDNNDLESFINLCTAHALYMKSAEFVKFFYSLINIFQYPAEQEYKNLIGLFGELSVIKYVFEKTGIDISSKWHKTGSGGKYDFVLDAFNLEIKSTTSFDKEVEIKHTQLFNTSNNYLAVVLLEKDNSGISTNQLIRDLLSSKDYCNNYDFSVNVEKERKRISPTDSENILFSVKEILFYFAKDINPFSVLPNNINSLSYKLDLSDSSEIVIDSIPFKN